MNLAGVKTVSHTVTNWNGERSISGDSAVTVAGVRTLHQCHLVVTRPKSTKIKREHFLKIQNPLHTRSSAPKGAEWSNVRK